MAHHQKRYHSGVSPETLPQALCAAAAAAAFTMARQSVSHSVKLSVSLSAGIARSHHKPAFASLPGAAPTSEHVHFRARPARRCAIAHHRDDARAVYEGADTCAWNCWSTKSERENSYDNGFCFFMLSERALVFCQRFQNQGWRLRGFSFQLFIIKEAAVSLSKRIVRLRKIIGKIFV